MPLVRLMRLIAPPLLPGGTGIAYNVYANDLAGGPVDDSTPVATVTAATWTPPSLAPGSDATFLVRPVAAGVENKTGALRRRIVTDAAGVDISRRPNAPDALRLLPMAGGRLAASFAYSPRGQGGEPTGFRVWATSGGSVDYTAPPAAVVPYDRRRNSWRVVLAGLVGGTAYAVGVRAYNAAGAETNTAFAAATVPSSASAPAPVTGASSSAVF